MSDRGCADRPASVSIAQVPIVSMTLGPTFQYLNEADVAALREGDCHRVANSIGGSFKVRFEGHQADKFVFRNISPGWHHWPLYDYTFDEVRRYVYDLVTDRGSNLDSTKSAGKLLT